MDETKMPIVNIAGYRFVDLPDRDELRQPFRDITAKLGLKGTILLSPNGINFFLAGTQKAVDSYISYLNNDERFKDIPLHISYTDYQPFRRMLVRLKKEIISLSEIKTSEPTEFIGYDEENSNEAQVKEVIKMKNGLAVIFDSSVCYPEMGGQVGDSGTIAAGGKLYKIKDNNVVANNYVLLFQNTQRETYTYNVEIIGEYADKIKIKKFTKFKLSRGKMAKKVIQLSKEKVKSNKEFFQILKARGNNLKNVDLKLPVGLMTCITGVSGSGKSTLINNTLYHALAKHLYKSNLEIGPHDEIKGYEFFDKVVDVNQSPIGRTPRSNPATYTGLFTPIRDIFSKVPESKLRGYAPGRFSFNVKGGRCESCEGDGVVKVEMHFLPDVYVKCDFCEGRRYNRETLEIKYKNKNIHDVLSMTVEQAYDFFSAIPVIERKLKTLLNVGLSYIKLGQNATTLSGGEAQRVKLALELSKRDTGRTLYILDEPTTGLHFADIQLLLNVLHQLKKNGNTLAIIEHNLDVIKTADWIIDLGPEGGDGGGQIIAEGSPSEICKNKNSYTGKFLKPYL